MPEQLPQLNLGAIWREQEREHDEAVSQEMIQHDAAELNASTRGETIASIAAVLFLIAAIAWRLEAGAKGWTAVALGVAGVWVIVSAYRFRRSISTSGEPSLDAMAENCSAFYRRQLERRRRHLENAWFWHGPVILACLVLAAVGFGELAPSRGQLLRASPLALLFLIWLVIGFLNRRRKVKQLQQQIDDIDRRIVGFEE